MANYFSYGTLSPAYRVVHRHAVHRVRQWLGRKFKIQGRGYYQFSDQHLTQRLGLLEQFHRGSSGSVGWGPS